MWWHLQCLARSHTRSSACISYHYHLPLPTYMFSQNTCVLTWTPSTTGWYAAAFQVEDFLSTSSTTPLSSVPLQFLFFVFTSNQPCTGGTRPSLVAGETPPDGSCIPVPFGTTYTAGLVASSGGSAVRYVCIGTCSSYKYATGVCKTLSTHSIVFAAYFSTPGKHATIRMYM